METKDLKWHLCGGNCQCEFMQALRKGKSTYAYSTSEVYVLTMLVCVNLCVWTADALLIYRILQH